jgi:hypothetical protein
VLSEWERSGLSQAEFCRQRGINAVTLAWWKRRLRGTDAPGGGRRGRWTGGPAPTGFVELPLPRAASARRVWHTLSGASSAQCYELVLPSGVELRLPEDFDPQRVARLVQALGAAC